MAKSAKKKPVSGSDNPSRRNGKAWKKPKAEPRKKVFPSEQRVLAKHRVLKAREERKFANIARREAEAAAREAKLAEEAAEKARRAEEDLLIREAEERNEKRRKGTLIFETLAVKSAVVDAA